MSTLLGGSAFPHHHHCKARTKLNYKNKITRNNKFSAPAVCRLFGPSMFDASKLRVVFIGEGEDDKKKKKKKKEPIIPRTYTLTHCDLTSNLTLSIAQTINTHQLQGWYNKLQRDEVIAEWKRSLLFKDDDKNMYCLHVHCHISGGHFLLDLFANLRYHIFRKELPLVLKAFLHGDCNLFTNYPELQEALVLVYFHSKNPKFDQVECWGPLSLASSGAHYKLLDGDGTGDGDDGEGDGVMWENLARAIIPHEENLFATE